MPPPERRSNAKPMSARAAHRSARSVLRPSRSCRSSSVQPRRPQRHATLLTVTGRGAPARLRPWFVPTFVYFVLKPLIRHRRRRPVSRIENGIILLPASESKPSMSPSTSGLGGNTGSGDTPTGSTTGSPRKATQRLARMPTAVASELFPQDAEAQTERAGLPQTKPDPDPQVAVF